MKYRTSFMALASVLLAGCLGAPAPDQPSLLRNPTVPLSIISRGGAEAMEGTWNVRGASAGYSSVQSVIFDTHATATPSVEFLQAGCDAAGNCEAVGDIWRAEALAQNRWRLSSDSADGPLELWVVWVDDGFRTAAIGSPDSDMAFVLDRKPNGGEDRIAAAREVMEFNGYNLTALHMR